MQAEEESKLTGDGSPTDEQERERLRKENRRAQIRQILREKLGIKEIRTILIGRSKRTLNQIAESEMRGIKNDAVNIVNGKLIF